MEDNLKEKDSDAFGKDADLDGYKAQKNKKIFLILILTIAIAILIILLIVFIANSGDEEDDNDFDKEKYSFEAIYKTNLNNQTINFFNLPINNIKEMILNKTKINNTKIIHLNL